jgi:hypothetical protein
MSCGGPNQAPCGRSSTTTPVAPRCPTQVWTAGPWMYVQTPDGCLTREAVGAPIPDGVYVNPQITMSGGHIVAVANGPAMAVVPPSPCAPAGMDSGGGGSPPLLVPDACNLMSMVQGRLQAKAFMTVADGTPMTITGCGTPENPFRFSLTLPETAGGVTYTGCGINIQNGRVVAFLPPVMDLVASEDSGLAIDVHPLTCQRTIRSATGAAVALLPAIRCDGSVDPPAGQVVGTPDTVYLLRLPNTASLVYTATTNVAGVATVSNMLGGVYEVVVGTRTLGYVNYVRCAYVAPEGS